MKASSRTILLEIFTVSKIRFLSSGSLRLISNDILIILSRDHAVIKGLVDYAVYEKAGIVALTIADFIPQAKKQKHSLIITKALLPY